MSKHSKASLRGDTGLIEIKSKFDAEFRRFSVDRKKVSRFGDFSEIVSSLHLLQDIPFVITYTDIHGDLLPINNDDNFYLALSTAKPVLRIHVQKKGESYAEINGYGAVKKRSSVGRPKLAISLPEDFRRVSAIIDVDIVPETHRRVKLMKNGSDKPLGFYIRDGTSVRVTPHGLEKVPGIFISRLVPGGLAESTGLLAVNDEVLEVNGIEVCGKTLDQVTDMMVANSSNLIITVKPVNQRLTLAPAQQRGGVGRYSQMSQASYMSSASGQSGHSRQSSKSLDSDLIAEQDDEDEVQDFLSKSERSNKSVLSEQSDRSELSEKSSRSERSGKSSPSEKRNRNDKTGQSNRSNGSGGQSNRSSGSGRQSNRSNGSGNGNKHSEPGNAKADKDGPVVTL